MPYIFAGQTLPPDVIASLPLSHVDFRSDVEQHHSQLSQENDNSPDILLAGTMSKEVIRLSGSEIDVFMRTDNNDVDHVWEEDTSPTFWQPITIKAYYVVPAITVTSEMWSVDAKVTFDVFLSYQEVLEMFGERMIRLGDVFKIPLKFVKPAKIVNFEVTSSTPWEMFMYHWLYWKCTVINISGDPIVQPEPKEPIIIGDHGSYSR